MASEVFSILGYSSRQLIERVYDLCKDIIDPEKPYTLEDLDVITVEDILVRPISSKLVEVEVIFTPTVPHYHSPMLIGLCLLFKLKESLPKQCKIIVGVQKDSHDAHEAINKLFRDKERVAAAIDNPHLMNIIRRCLEDS